MRVQLIEQRESIENLKLTGNTLRTFIQTSEHLKQEIQVQINFNLTIACDLKNSGNYSSGLSCPWALFTAWAFGFKQHLILSYFKNRFNILFGIFIVGIGAFRVLMRTRLNIEPYSPLKPTKVGFIFIGPNSVNRA